MQKIEFLLLKILLLTTVSVGFCACIKQDISTCYRVNLQVKFDPDMFELPENEHQIEKVTVYVFDTNFNLVTVWEGGAYNYLTGADYPVSVTLEEGIYQFIAWTNKGDFYKTNPAYQRQSAFIPFDEMRLYRESASENSYREDIPDLHYGRLQQVDYRLTQNHSYTLYLLPNTYRINLSVEGLEPTKDEYEFIIRDTNFLYGFDNSIVPGKEHYEHIRSCYFQENELNASMRILSLTENHTFPEPLTGSSQTDRNIQFTFLNTSTGITHYSADLVKMIRMAYESSGQVVNFDKTYLFNIRLTFDVQMNVTFSVNGWTYQYNPTEL